MEVPAGQRNQYLVDVILEKEERSDAGFFISDGAGVKEVRPMDKENMALLDLLGFCIHLTWIL